MGNEALRQRIRELIERDRDEGTVRPSGYYQRVFKGFEDLVEEALRDLDPASPLDAQAAESPAEATEREPVAEVAPTAATHPDTEAQASADGAVAEAADTARDDDEVPRGPARHPAGHATGPWKELRAWADRHRLLALGVVAALALAAAGLVALAVLYAQSRERSAELARAAYRASLGAAADGLDAGDLEAAREHLERTPLELRDWSWDMLAARLDGGDSGAPAATLEGHASYVYAAAVSPDGGLLASGGWDALDGGGASIRIWDAETYAPVATIGTPDDCAFALAFSPDSSQLVACGGTRESGWRHGPVRVYDTATGTLVRSLTRSFHVLALSADGKTLFGARKGRVEVIEFETDTSLGVIPDVPATRLRLSADGALLAASGEGGVAVIDTRTRKLLWTNRETPRVWDAFFSPDGARVVVAGGSDELSVLDAATGTRIGALVGHRGEPLCGVYSADGARILTGSRDRTIRVWDARTLEQVTRLGRHDGYVYEITFAPEGERVISASGDRTLRAWESRIAAERRAAHEKRDALVAALQPQVRSELDAGTAAADVIANLGASRDARGRQILRQLVLAESVARRAR